MKSFVTFMLFLSIVMPFTGVILCVLAPIKADVNYALIGQAMVIAGMSISSLFIKLAEYSGLNKPKIYSMSDYNKRK